MNVVTSNGLPIPFDAAHFAPLAESSGSLCDPATLCRRFREDGYLYLRGMLDRREVLALRAAYFAQFDPLYLEPGTSPCEGIYSGVKPQGLPPHGTAGHPAHTFVRSEVFDEFLRSERLRSIASIVLGGEVEILPRRIVRHFCRDSGVASRAHVDHDYLSEGSQQVLTMWIPVGDCPVATGGLVYLEGSHTVDSGALLRLRSVTDRPNDKRPISHDLAYVARELKRRWLWADYRAGDVALHSPHIVHASLDTVTYAMRLSIDIRFILKGEPVDPRWQTAWAGDDGN